MNEIKTVDQIIKKLKRGELDNPSELADFVVILSASLFQASEFETEAEIEYVKKWSKIKEEDHTDKMTDALTKQTDEYRLWQKMRNSQKCLIETIRALKKKLSNLQDEFRSGQNY